MTEPILPVAEMEAEVRRCAMALLPAESNGRVEYQTTPAVNALGEPTGAPVMAGWDARITLLDLRERRGVWTPAGIVDAGTQRALVAVADGVEGFAPVTGHLVIMGGERWRIERLLHLPVDGTAYYEATLKKVRQ